jgi:hypothetical protein
MPDLALVPLTDLVDELDRRTDAMVVLLWRERSAADAEFRSYRRGALHVALGLAHHAMHDMQADLARLTSIAPEDGGPVEPDDTW